MIYQSIKRVLASAFIFVLSLGMVGAIYAESNGVPAALKDLSIGGVMYVSYQNGQQLNPSGQLDSYNLFTLKRGYLDVKKGLISNFMVRYTTDITRSNGSWNTRVKYLYGKYSLPQFLFFTQPGVEFGQVHVPWHDFEESINGFRMQDPMFLERFGVFNSADDGFTFGANFGGELSREYQANVNKHYAGRYGSMQIGVYNGGGYHAAEMNENKVVEARVTIRPIPDIIPGLQLTALDIYGKGNATTPAAGDLPDWTAFNGMVSYQSEMVTLTGQYYTGSGNQSGLALDGNGNALDQSGYSIFGALHLGNSSQYSVIARYDMFDSNTNSSSNDEEILMIGGVSWKMNSAATWLLDYQRKDHSLDRLSAEDRVQVTLQTKF